MLCRKHAKIFKCHRGRWSEEQTMLAAVPSPGRDGCMGWALGFCGWWIKAELRFYLFSGFHVVSCPGMSQLRKVLHVVKVTDQVGISNTQGSHASSVIRCIRWGAGKWKSGNGLETEASRCQITFYCTYELALNLNSWNSSKWLGLLFSGMGFFTTLFFSWTVFSLQGLVKQGRKLVVFAWEEALGGSWPSVQSLEVESGLGSA